METNLGNYQSILQLFTAIYLVAEWINVDRISAYYKERYKKELRYRMKVAAKYSGEVKEFFDEFEEKDWGMLNFKLLHKRFSSFRRICFVFFTLSLSGLLITSFFPEQLVDRILMVWVVGFLFLPFVWVLFGLLKPAREDYKFIKSTVDEILSPIENEGKIYKECHAEPQMKDAFAKRNSGQEDALVNYLREKREYNKEYLKHMKSKFSG